MLAQRFNSNSNSIINNNEIEIREPNDNKISFNAIMGFERIIFKFNLDPNIFTTNLTK